MDLVGLFVLVMAEAILVPLALVGLVPLGLALWRRPRGRLARWPLGFNLPVFVAILLSPPDRLRPAMLLPEDGIALTMLACAMLRGLVAWLARRRWERRWTPPTATPPALAGAPLEQERAACMAT